jgi:hypothetical protein
MPDTAEHAFKFSNITLRWMIEEVVRTVTVEIESNATTILFNFDTFDRWHTLRAIRQHLAKCHAREREQAWRRQRQERCRAEDPRRAVKKSLMVVVRNYSGAQRVLECEGQLGYHMVMGIRRPGIDC